MSHHPESAGSSAAPGSVAKPGTTVSSTTAIAVRRRAFVELVILPDGARERAHCPLVRLDVMLDVEALHV